MLHEVTDDMEQQVQQGEPHDAAEDGLHLVVFHYAPLSMIMGQKKHEKFDVLSFSSLQDVYLLRPTPTLILDMTITSIHQPLAGIP